MTYDFFNPAVCSLRENQSGSNSSRNWTGTVNSCDLSLTLFFLCVYVWGGNIWSNWNCWCLLRPKRICAFCKYMHELQISLLYSYLLFLSQSVLLYRCISFSQMHNSSFFLFFLSVFVLFLLSCIFFRVDTHTRRWTATLVLSKDVVRLRGRLSDVKLWYHHHTVD